MRPIIFSSRQENKARESTRTLQPITNDASRSYFSYTRPDITTENEIVEPNPATTIIRQPISKILLALLYYSQKSAFAFFLNPKHRQQGSYVNFP